LRKDGIRTVLLPSVLLFLNFTFFFVVVVVVVLVVVMVIASFQ